MSKMRVSTKISKFSTFIHDELIYQAKASIAIFHGFAQGSDMLVEMGIMFAKNGYQVHLVDFRGYGWSGGARCWHSILDFQHDVVTLLKYVDPDLPLFFFLS
jgi:acylglycerol lipase